MQWNRENQPSVQWWLSNRGSVARVGSVSVPKLVKFFEIADVFLDGVPVALGNQYGPVGLGHVNRSTRNGIKVPAFPAGFGAAPPNNCGGEVVNRALSMVGPAREHIKTLYFE